MEINSIYEKKSIFYLYLNRHYGFIYNLISDINS
jgi:hypothetical protein